MDTNRTVSGKQSAWLQAFALVLITNLLYFRCLAYPFTWDDDTHLTTNLLTQPGGLWRSWFTSEQPNYWPVTWTAFWLQLKAWGLQPLPYRVLNVQLHVGCALLCWRIVKRLEVPGAWLGALLFAVHPVNVESVAWITQLKTLLSTFFFFVSMLGYLMYVETKRVRWYWVTIAAFALGLLAKSGVAVLPAVLLVLLWRKQGAPSIKKFAPGLLVLFAMAFAQVCLEIWFQTYRAAGTVTVRNDDLLARIVGVGQIAWFYLYKAVWPLELSFVYPRWKLDGTDPVQHLPNLLLVLAVYAVWKLRTRYGVGPLAGVLYYLITLSPLLGLVTVFFFRYSYVADHYQYASLIAVTAGIAAALHQLAMKRGSYALVARAGQLLLVAGLVLLSWNQQGIYRTTESLWRDTLVHNPEASIAHNNLGNIMLFEQKKPEDAVRHYARSLELTPDNHNLYTNLSFALLQTGNPAAAEKVTSHVLARHPNFAEGYAALGDVYTVTDNTTAAMEAYRRAFTLNPKLAVAKQRWQELHEAQATSATVSAN